MSDRKSDRIQKLFTDLGLGLSCNKQKDSALAEIVVIHKKATGHLFFKNFLYCESDVSQSVSDSVIFACIVRQYHDRRTTEKEKIAMVMAITNVARTRERNGCKRSAHILALLRQCLFGVDAEEIAKIVSFFALDKMTDTDRWLVASVFPESAVSFAPKANKCYMHNSLAQYLTEQASRSETLQSKFHRVWTVCDTELATQVEHLHRHMLHKTFEPKSSWCERKFLVPYHKAIALRNLLLSFALPADASGGCQKSHLYKVLQQFRSITLRQADSCLTMYSGPLCHFLHKMRARSSVQSMFARAGSLFPLLQQICGSKLIANYVLSAMLIEERATCVALLYDSAPVAFREFCLFANVQVFMPLMMPLENHPEGLTRVEVQTNGDDSLPALTLHSYGTYSHFFNGTWNSNDSNNNYKRGQNHVLYYEHLDDVCCLTGQQVLHILSPSVAAVALLIHYQPLSDAKETTTTTLDSITVSFKGAQTLVHCTREECFVRREIDGSEWYSVSLMPYTSNRNVLQYTVQPPNEIDWPIYANFDSLSISIRQSGSGDLAANYSLYARRLNVNHVMFGDDNVAMRGFYFT